ncbi:MAG: 7-carboxy-7-deazaguanine synthase QueE [Flavobacteriales bacterium]|nr:7-carboxy-7-deazaguanine synthase QueE [Flavobacteriales bacterium]
MNTITSSAVYTLPIMEHFATLQGEGFHAGKPAYFIRTGGCDVGCHWCDVKESWPGDGHVPMNVNELQEEAQQHDMDIVVVTGGEPTMYDLEPLTAGLRSLGKRTHIETSGVYPLTGTWDWITFSPKKFKAPTEGVYKKAHELKVVVSHPSDFEFAEVHAAKVDPSCKLYLQPEWSKRERMMPLIVAYIKQHPQWRMSLQTHKYLNIP